MEITTDQNTLLKGCQGDGWSRDTAAGGARSHRQETLHFATRDAKQLNLCQGKLLRGRFFLFWSGAPFLKCYLW